MNRFDFTPYRRSTVGFDRLFDLLESQVRNSAGDNYPPFNIERRGEDSYRITLAVAGFREEDLDITAHQIDDQQTVGKIGAFDADEVRQLETALETAIGDADVEHLALGAVLALAALDHQQVLVRGDVEVFGPEARDRQGDAVGIVAAALDVVRRVVVAAAGGADLVLEQVEQAVETDRGAAIGSEIETVHRNKSSCEQFEWFAGPANAAPACRNALAARCDRC